MKTKGEIINHVLRNYPAKTGEHRVITLNQALMMLDVYLEQFKKPSVKRSEKVCSVCNGFNWYIEESGGKTQWKRCRHSKPKHEAD